VRPIRHILVLTAVTLLIATRPAIAAEVPPETVTAQLPAWLLAELRRESEKLPGRTAEDRAVGALASFTNGTYGFSFEGAQSVRVISELGYGGLEAERAWQEGARSPALQAALKEFYCRAAGFNARTFYDIYRYANDKQRWRLADRLEKEASRDAFRKLDAVTGERCLQLTAPYANGPPINGHTAWMRGLVGWKRGDLLAVADGFATGLTEPTATEAQNWSYYAASLFLTGRAESGVQIWMKALGLLPQLSDENRQRALDTLDHAVRTGRELDALGPGAVTDPVARGEILFKAGYENAAERLMRGANAAGQANGLLVLARLYSQNRRFEKSNQLLDEISLGARKYPDALRLDLVNTVNLLQNAGLVSPAGRPHRERLRRAAAAHRASDSDLADTVLFLLSIAEQLEGAPQQGETFVAEIYFPSVVAFKQAHPDSTHAWGLFQIAAVFSPAFLVSLNEFGSPLPQDYASAISLHVPLTETYLGVAEATQSPSALRGFLKRLPTYLPLSSEDGVRALLQAQALRGLARLTNAPELRRAALDVLRPFDHGGDSAFDLRVGNAMAVLLAESGDVVLAEKRWTEIADKGKGTVSYFNLRIAKAIVSPSAIDALSSRFPTPQLEYAIDAWLHFLKRPPRYRSGSDDPTLLSGPNKNGVFWVAEQSQVDLQANERGLQLSLFMPVASDMIWLPSGVVE
jgi:hypothetical protein